jgi:hypothetical protein
MKKGKEEMTKSREIQISKIFSSVNNYKIGNYYTSAENE